MPSKSTDLNPIENVWNELDKRVWQRQPLSEREGGERTQTDVSLTTSPL